MSAATTAQIIHNIPTSAHAQRMRRPTATTTTTSSVAKFEEENYIQTLKKALSTVIDENETVSQIH